MKKRFKHQISDDDFLIDNVINDIMNISHEKNKTKIFVIGLLLYAEKLQPKLRNYTSDYAENYFEKCHELNQKFTKKDLTKKVYFAYGIRNAYERILDLCMKEPVDINSILKVKDEIVYSHRFNPYNREQWKKFSLLDSKDILIVKDKIKKLRLQGFELKYIKTIGFTTIRDKSIVSNKDTFDYHNNKTFDVEFKKKK